MKGAADRTKVVLRHLPPTITQEMLMEQIDEKFGGRYNWTSFRPGKSSLKHQIYSRAYINFQRPEDVIEFADFFGGHVFVNEKGTQFKTIVEYAPSERVARQLSKKDGREGTIHKDPLYLEFLESIAKPTENLPSAEIQLERKEAERAGAVKDAPIVTPLMHFVRQKRAAKGGLRRSSSNGKPTRTGGVSSETSGSASLRRGSDKRKYILKDPTKSTSGKVKSAYIMVPKQNDQQMSDSSIAVATSGTEVIGDESGVPGIAKTGKKKILLLKGQEKVSHVSSDLPLKQTAAPPVKNPIGATVLKHTHQRGASGKIIKSILLNKDSRQSPSMLITNTQNQVSHQEEDKRVAPPPKLQNFRVDTDGDNTVTTEKQEKRTSNKGRPDRGVWTALRRSDGSNTSNESLPPANPQHTKSFVDHAEGVQGDLKKILLSSKSGELKQVGSGWYTPDNGSYKHGWRGLLHNGKDTDAYLIIGEGKPPKRGASSVYGSHEVVQPRNWHTFARSERCCNEKRSENKSKRQPYFIPMHKHGSHSKTIGGYGR